MAVTAMSRAATASTQTPAVNAAAPTHAPGSEKLQYSVRAVAAMVEIRTTVPRATRRVRPERISRPCTNRRYPMAPAHGRKIHRAP